MSRPASPPSRRVWAIDALKGVAMLGVMAQHGLPVHILSSSWSDLHIRQAVPVFFVVMGLNAAGSFERRRAGRLGELYDSAYRHGRLVRLGLPFAAIWLVAALLGVVTGRLALGPTTLIGNLPFPGPGNYFVTVVLVLAAVLPVLWWAFVRRPVLVLVGCLAVDAGFELISGHSFSVSRSDPYPYAYYSCFLRFLAPIALGMWIARTRSSGRGGTTWIVALAPLSLAFLVVLDGSPPTLGGYGFLVPGFGQGSGVGGVFWAATLVLGALALPRNLPGRAMIRLPAAVLGELGRASYQIFLVQILWFGVPMHRSVLLFVAGTVGASVTGWAFWRLCPQPGPRRSSPLPAEWRGAPRPVADDSATARPARARAAPAADSTGSR